MLSDVFKDQQGKGRELQHCEEKTSVKEPKGLLQVRGQSSAALEYERGGLVRCFILLTTS